MIEYNKGRWGLLFILSIRGSIFPKSFAFALPCSIASAMICHVYYSHNDLIGLINDWWGQASTVSGVWVCFTGVVGFLLVFRTQQAYARYWEGATLLRQARGQWFICTSSLVAFCKRDDEIGSEVDKFQHCLVRLMSLLNCVALQTVADSEGQSFSVLATAGLDQSSLEYLYSKDDKNQQCEILIQWIQRLVIDAMHKGVLNVRAPILTRFFQELSVGFVNISQARNLSDIPFPYPYAQMIQLMLIFHMLATPWVSALVLQTPGLSAIFTFALVLTFVGVNYIASEIEDPFGEDSNHLPLSVLQDDFNSSLWMLLDQKTQDPPDFVFDDDLHRTWSIWNTTESDNGMSCSNYQKKKKSFYSPTKKSSGVGSTSTSLSLPLRPKTSGCDERSVGSDDSDDGSKEALDTARPLASLENDYLSKHDFVEDETNKEMQRQGSPKLEAEVPGRTSLSSGSPRARTSGVKDSAPGSLRTSLMSGKSLASGVSLVSGRYWIGKIASYVSRKASSPQPNTDTPTRSFPAMTWQQSVEATRSILRSEMASSKPSDEDHRGVAQASGESVSGRQAAHVNRDFAADPQPVKTADEEFPGVDEDPSQGILTDATFDLPLPRQL